MKQFLTSMMEWKTGACLLYTGAMVLYMAVLFLLDVQPERATLLSLLLVSAAGSLIQFVVFTDRVIKRLRYSLRLLLFVVLFLPLLTGCAALGRWFPLERQGSWMLFAGIFLAIFLIFTAGFELYFHLTGRKYDGILGQYKKQREQQH